MKPAFKKELIALFYVILAIFLVASQYFKDARLRMAISARSAHANWLL